MHFRGLPRNAYLKFDVRAHVLACVGGVEEVQDGGDECLIDAAELAVDDTLQDGAEPAPLCHHRRVLQGYRVGVGVGVETLD